MPMKIGELARQSGCRVVTIRYYEKEGLLAAAPRTSANYRLYSEADASRLRFIRRCRLHGMTLAEIRELLAMQDHHSVSCRRVHALIREHMFNVEAQIRDLEHLKAHLRELLDDCSGRVDDACRILQRLEHGEPCVRCQARECRFAGLSGEATERAQATQKKRGARQKADAGTGE